MQLIEKEMRSAQHLLYVSLKYTKTCDVILNLIERWQNLIELSIESLLNKAKKKKIISKIPEAPKLKIDLTAKLFKKEPLVKDILILYSFFRKINTLKQIKEHEFRKNVTLRVINGNEIAINMDKLKEWQELLESFIKFVRSSIK